MKFPNKVTTYKDSSIALFPVILGYLEKQPITPSELYKKVKNKTNGLTEYMEILDCLYILNKIELEGEVLRYVD